jgi:hypothetical protein
MAIDIADRLGRRCFSDSPIGVGCAGKGGLGGRPAGTSSLTPRECDGEQQSPSDPSPEMSAHCEPSFPNGNQPSLSISRNELSLMHSRIPDNLAPRGPFRRSRVSKITRRREVPTRAIRQDGSIWRLLPCPQTTHVDCADSREQCGDLPGGVLPREFRVEDSTARPNSASRESCSRKPFEHRC